MAFCGSLRIVCLVIFCTCIMASPTRRQFFDINSDSSTVEPPASVLKEDVTWEDGDDFDFDGNNNWLTDSSPSSIPSRQSNADYDDYDVNADDLKKDVSLEDDDDDDVKVQDGEEDADSDFLFVPQEQDSRLLLQDDDSNQPGLIRVRHTKNNNVEDSDPNENNVDSITNEGQQDKFEFSIDDSNEDVKNINNDNKDDDDSDDDNDEDKDNVVIKKLSQKQQKIAERMEAGDFDPNDEFEDEDDDDEDTIFESPEEDTKVIYGDHVFLY